MTAARRDRDDTDRAFVVQLGHVLRIERQVRGWSQEAVAKEAGFSRQTILHIELGQFPEPSIVTTRRIAAVFDKSLSEILAMVEPGLPRKR